MYHTNESIITQTYGVRFVNKQQLVQEIQTRYTQVSQRIGNSLCSHPALFISAFGGIILYLLMGFQDILRG